MDGITNVWILKPGNKSRGRGIVLMSKLEDVVAKVNPTGKSDTRYVVQKYIGNRDSEINTQNARSIDRHSRSSLGHLFPSKEQGYISEEVCVRVCVWANVHGLAF